MAMAEQIVCFVGHCWVNVKCAMFGMRSLTDFGKHSSRAHQCPLDRARGGRRPCKAVKRVKSWLQLARISVIASIRI